MNYSNHIQLMALIFAVVASVKILVILIYPKFWAKQVVKRVWTKPDVMIWISLVLAVICFYFLIQELTIVQIFAVMLFVSLLAAIGVAIYANSVVNMALRLLRDRELVKKSWLYLVLWIALLAFGFYKLFM